MSRHAVDWPRLLAALDATCTLRHLSYRAVAEQIGISPSGLTRLRQGKRLEADALAALTAWLYPGQIPRWVREVPDRAPQVEQEPTVPPPSAATSEPKGRS